MPTDPTPEAQGILSNPQVKPFPEPAPGLSDKDELGGREQEASESLVSPDMEEPAETNRPPLGN